MGLRYGGTEVIGGEVFALLGKTDGAGYWRAAWRVPIGRVAPRAGAYVAFNRHELPIAWGDRCHCVETLADEFLALWAWHDGHVRPLRRCYPGWRRIL
mgnify:CR=1 FL=1